VLSSPPSENSQMERSIPMPIHVFLRPDRVMILVHTCR
jgi:hypothetical protein